MSSSSLRVLVEMRWEKEQNLEGLLAVSHDPALYALPMEGQWRAQLRLAGWESRLPELGMNGPEQLLVSCYGQLIQSRKMRRDLKELNDVIIQMQLFQRLVGVIASTHPKDPGAAFEAGKLTGDHVDEIYTLLHNVQKRDNPLAVRPQSEAADTLEKDMERLSAFFDEARPIRITTTD